MSFISFRQVLKQAWKVTAKHPFLWLLGIFAAASINTGIYQGAINNIAVLLRTNNFLGSVQDLYTRGMFNQIVEFSTTKMPSLAAGNSFWSVIFFIGLLFAIYITIISQIAIIKSTPALAAGKSMSLSESFQGAQKHFIPVLVITLLSRLIYILLFVLTSFPIYFSMTVKNGAGIVISTVVFFFLFIPLSLVIAFVSTYAVNFAIFEDSHLFISFQRGWNLFKNNFILSIEIGLVLMLIKIGAILATIILAGIIFVPVGAIIAALFALQQAAVFSLFLVVAVIIGIIAYLLVNGFFTAFYLTTWTTLFRALTSNTLRSKLDRLMDSLFSVFVKTGNVKEVAMGTAMTAHDVYQAAQKKYQQMRPTLDEIIDEIEERYKAAKPQLKQINKELDKVIAKEKKEFIPQMQKVNAEVRKGIKKATPKVKAGATVISKTVAKKFPEVKRFADEVQKKYQEELSKELRKVAKKKPAAKKTSKKR